MVLMPNEMDGLPMKNKIIIGVFARAFRLTLLLSGFATVLIPSLAQSGVVDAYPDRKEQPMGGCNDYNPLKNPYFGDLHVHTAYSLDAAQTGTRTTPADAYAFAKGAPIGIAPFDENGQPYSVDQLERPLDFAASTEHAEWLAEANICWDDKHSLYHRPYCVLMRAAIDRGKAIQAYEAFTKVLGYGADNVLNLKNDAKVCQDSTHYLADSDYCKLVRDRESGLIKTSAASSSGTTAKFLSFLLAVAPVADPTGRLKSPLCLLNKKACGSSLDTVWDKIQKQAEDHYDRSDNCSFTTFVGYEWTGAPAGNNLHRNIIFRGSNVSTKPISYLDEKDPLDLWAQLASGCNDTGTGCEALTIAHGSNLANGFFFNPVRQGRLLGIYGLTKPYTTADAALRSRMETLVEIFQHKGYSECTPGSGEFASDDDACYMELINSNICTGGENDREGCIPMCKEGAANIGGFFGTCIAPSDFARAALRNGLKIEATLGKNPFKFGVIGSTDNHTGTAGSTEEVNWNGYFGSTDANPYTRVADPGEPANFAEHLGNELFELDKFSPGGLTVAWAEQNSRNPLFDALKNKETYATSGTRMIVRFFGGWEYPEKLCDDPDFVAKGYRSGVAMGGDLPPRPKNAGAPKFAISAMMDSGTLTRPGTELQRVQMVKGWVENGVSKERVFDVAGNANNGAGVDVKTCETYGSGAALLCTVWEDPEFNPEQSAVYYARVLENPTCRWSRYSCNALFQQQQLSCDTLPADHELHRCCDGGMPDTIQERAATSGIWYTPTQP